MRSLDRLQALGEVGDIDKSLENAFKLAGLDTGNGSNYSSHGRAEWVLKWILKNLKVGDKNNTATLAYSPRAWALLSTLLNVIPPTTLGRILQGEELAKLGDAAFNRVAVSNSQDTTHAHRTVTNGLKRKREDKSSEHGSDSKQLFDSALEFFTKSLRLFSGSVGTLDEVERFQLQSVFRIPAEAAANLLSSCLNAICVSLSQDYCPKFSSVSSVFVLWQKRQVAAKGDLTSSQLFASKLLVPAALLYGQLDAYKAKCVASDFSEASLFDAEIEQLFSEHLFGPIRNHYNLKNPYSVLASEFYTPLKEAFQGLKKFVQSAHASSDLLKHNGVIIRLFDMAVSRSGLSNPKSKELDNAWLESLLRVLAECAGDLSTGEKINITKPSGISTTVLEDLLTVAKRKGLSLSSEVLGRILYETSGLFQGPDTNHQPNKPIHVPIIIKVIDLDSSMIVDPQQSSKDGKYLDVKTSLLAHITRIAYDSSKTSKQDILLSQLITKLVDSYAGLQNLPDFISEWFEILKTQANLIAGPNQGPTIWTSQLLIDHISKHTKDSLSLELSTLIREYSFSLSEKYPDLDGFANSISLSPSLVVLEALIGGAKDTAEYLKLLTELSSWICELSLLCGNAKFVARFWRIQALIDSQTFYDENADGYPISGLQLLSYSSLGIRQHSPSLESLDLVDGESSLLIESYTLAVIDFATLAAKGLASDDHVKPVREYFATLFLFQRNAGVLEFRAPLAALVNAFQLAIRYPVILTYLEVEHRMGLYHASLALASSSKYSDGALLLHTLQQAISEAGAGYLMREFFSVIADYLYPTYVQIGTEVPVSVQFDMVTMDIPVVAMTQGEREGLLNHITSSSDRDESSIKMGSQQVLLSISKLTTEKCYSADLFRFPEKITSDLAYIMNMHWQTYNTVEYVEIFRGIVKKVLFYHESKSQDTTYRTEFRKLFCQRVCESDNLKKQLWEDPGAFALVIECLSIRFVDCEKCYNKTLETLKQDIPNWVICIKDESASKLSVLNCTLATTLALKHPTLAALDLTKLFDGILNCSFQLSEDAVSHKSEFFVSVAKLATASRLKSSNVRAIYSRILSLIGLLPSAKCSLIEDYTHYAAKLPLPELLNSNAMGTSGDLQLLLANLRHITPKKLQAYLLDKQSVSREQDLKKLLPSLSNMLIQSTNQQRSGLSITLIGYILKHKRFMVNQYGIESVLSSLHWLVSQQYLNYLKGGSSSLFLKICQILGTLLHSYRIQLTERVHLLIPLFQRLMTGLLILHPKSKPNKSQQPPAWLTSTGDILNDIHANAFARVLQIFTHPTVSSVSKQSLERPNSLLTDETKKVRTHISKYTAYLLIHYCELQLVGRFSPDVRKALLPGIWACIEITPQEKLQGMNASMGRDEREIWKSLWAEWKRRQGAKS